MGRLKGREKVDEAIIDEWLLRAAGEREGGYLARAGLTLSGRIETHLPLRPVAILSEDGCTSAWVDMSDWTLNQETHEYLLERLLLEGFNLFDGVREALPEISSRVYRVDRERPLSLLWDVRGRRVADL